MYPVTELYKEKIKENNRVFECKIQIDHSQGTLYLYDKDLAQGTLTYSESSQSGEEFTIGSTVASDISFTILNKPEYKDIQFMGATVFVNIGLLVKEGADAHFLQPSQPSKIQGFEEKWEYVPLGKFNIDDVKRLRNTIELKAIDNMIKLDIPYSLSQLSYPATLYQIYVNICNIADIQVGTFDFPNKDYIVQERPSNDLTLRDVLGYVAELSGTFARMNRKGASELKWYESTDIELDPSNRFNFKPSDDIVQIKGLMATVGSTTYLVGSEDYAIDLTENPLLQDNYQTTLPNIFNAIKDTVFTPYTSDWQGNPAIQAGDIIVQVDRDGKTYNTLVTKSIYKYRGKSILEAKGLAEISKGYKGSTNKRIAEIKRKIEVEVGDKLTTLEEAQVNATELLANMLGGYIVEDKANGIFYIADNPNIDLAIKVWKYGINGFGYSSTGKDGPYTTAVTADGSIVAMLVAAKIITADMIEAGILQSKNGASWINLDTGAYNFGGTVKYSSENGLEVFEGNTRKMQMGYIDTDGNNIKDTYGLNVELDDGTITSLSGKGLKRAFPDGKFVTYDMSTYYIPQSYNRTQGWSEEIKCYRYAFQTRLYPNPTYANGYWDISAAIAGITPGLGRAVAMANASTSRLTDEFGEQYVLLNVTFMTHKIEGVDEALISPTDFWYNPSIRIQITESSFVPYTPDI